MSYSKYYASGFLSGETGGTPLTAEAMNHMENGIQTAALAADNAQTAANGKQAKHKTATVTLTSSGWSSNQQTVSVSGVTASNTVIVTHAPASYANYVNCGVRCLAQAAGKLTFACNSKPSANITVNVLILD